MSIAPANRNTIAQAAFLSDCPGKIGRLVTAVLIAAVIFHARPVSIAQASPVGIESFYAFGDSFVEVGNHHRLTNGEIPRPPYFEGRFANGPIWVDQLTGWAGLNIKPSEAGFDPATDRAVSFGYGGAGTGQGNLSPAGVPVLGLQAQVARFRGALATAGLAADPDALYVVWSGPNDYLLNIIGGPAESVSNIATALDALYDAGARHFLVPNIPDMGMTPAVVAAGLGPQFSGLTQGHNALLAAALAKFHRDRPDARIDALDVYALFNEILADPTAFGFSTDLGAGAASGCIFPPFVCHPVGATDMFFWDEVHPTTAVHRLIAAAAAGALAVPEPGGLTLLGVGLLGAGFLARRTRGMNREVSTPAGV